MIKLAALIVGLGLMLAPKLIPELWIITAVINLLDVTFHEMSHALAAFLTGGHVHSIQLSLNGSGVTYTSGGSAWFITSAGYPGVAVIAGFSTVLAARGLPSTVLLTWMMLLLAATVFSFGSGGETLIVSLAVMVSIVVLSLFPRQVKSLVVGLVCLLVLVHSFYSSLELFYFPAGSRHDAFFLAQRTVLPELFWKTFMLVVTVLAMVTTYRLLPSSIPSSSSARRPA